MPIEELLALYRCNLPTAIVETTNVTSTNDDENPTTADTQQQDQEPDISEGTSQLDNDKAELSEQETESMDRIEPSNNLRKLISTSEDALYDISDDEDDDDDDTPEEDHWRRTIQVGPDHQATVSEQPILKIDEEDLSEIDSIMNTDHSMLLWNPKHLNEEQVEFFLKIFLNNNSEKNLNVLSDKSTKLNDEISSTVVDSLQQQRDDELALFVLFKNDYEVETALNLLNDKTKLNKEFIDLFTFIEQWSEEDCDLFEDGLRVYGKDFHQIQINKLPHKTVNELVNFYYLWKKTERHDMFTSKFRFEKKKYSLNPNTTDLMDHFLDDHQSQPNQTSFNSTSSSLNNSHNSSVLHHNRHHRHVSSLTLLPTSNYSLSNHSDNSIGNISSTNLTTVTANNEAQQTAATNEDSNHSSDDRSSNLIINEIGNSNEEQQQIVKNKTDLIECPDSSTAESVVQSTEASNLTNNVTSSTNPSEL